MTTQNPMKAAAFMMGAVVSFTTMAIAGREISHELDTFEIMTYRSFIGVAVVLLVGGWAGTLHQINGRQMGLHGLRNVAHFTGQNLWFYALTVVTLPQLFAFEFSVPLWVALFAPIFLAEKLTLVRFGSAFIGFAGILMVARPDQIGLDSAIITAACFGLALAFAGASIATKILTRTQSITSIMFWLTVMQAVMGLICAGFDGDISAPSRPMLPFMILIGFAGLFAHFCITSAMQLAPATFVLPFDFVRLPLVAIIGILFYEELFSPLVFVGALVILAANAINLRAESRKSRGVPVPANMP